MSRLECKDLTDPLRFLFLDYIRICPDWNVKSARLELEFADTSIRICPDWNVKLVDSRLSDLQALIRICPDWNVK